MKKKKIIIWASALILFINLPLWDFFLDRWYTYSNADGSFRFEEIPGKGFDATSVFLRYGAFLCQRPEKDRGDNNLYRNFTVQPWRFWEWRQMLMHYDRFSLPYKAP